ncbi:TIGR03086 family protein [Nocardioides anomalus]|uniref:TIGR03086 family protein n=1 Tax=Nocardioides anomalus TaxID=2712223 RepID=A0A6G6WGM8_9ACTN|nr:TIGR03086 family metal-binding protein [Nocardioides anomalus]QIG44366.1 TIGR03086 family protein [Nocardioides anomalus]
MDLEDLTRAQDATATLLADFDTPDWERPSPCTDWDVEAVVRHLVVGERHFAESLRGTAGDAAELTAQVGEVPNADLPAAYAESSARLREALAAADPAATYPTGLGPVPPAVVLQLRTVEAIVHGWDAGRGVGRLLPVDDDVAERALDSSRALLEQVPPERSPFAPSVAVPDDATPLQRLVGLLGRDPFGSISG